MTTPKVENMLEGVEATSEFLRHGMTGEVLFDLLHRRPHPYTRHQLEVHLRTVPWNFNEESLAAEPCGNCLAYGYSTQKFGGKEGFCSDECSLLLGDGRDGKVAEAIVQEWLDLFDLVSKDE